MLDATPKVEGLAMVAMMMLQETKAGMRMPNVNPLDKMIHSDDENEYSSSYCFDKPC